MSASEGMLYSETSCKKKEEDSKLKTSDDEMGQIKSKVKKINKGAVSTAKNMKMEDEGAVKDHPFMCGVVEGFYGRPWTTEQRLELFKRMKMMGLNTYLYGPKDDYKHRLFWREKYSHDEAEFLRKLIEESRSQGVTFVYAISPGLDMVFTAEKEIKALEQKLLQVQELGCTAFALLFDDIDPVLCANDSERYESSSHAQASITNQMFESLSRPRFLFCPTEYCSNMANPNVQNSQYLRTLGTQLHPEVSILWTGPKVVSNTISVESIQELNTILQRKVMIWDNLHANDYDPKRVFFGPYKGRSTDLEPHLSGILTNPNCEFESNFVALHTLATWWKCSLMLEPPKDDSAAAVVAGKKDDEEAANAEAPAAAAVPVARGENISDDDSDYSSRDSTAQNSSALHQQHQNFCHGRYHPKMALEKALRDWLPLFSCPRYATPKLIPRSGGITTSMPPPVVSAAPPHPSQTTPTSSTQSLSQPIITSTIQEPLLTSAAAAGDKSAAPLDPPPPIIDVEIASNSSNDNSSKIEGDVPPSAVKIDVEMRGEDSTASSSSKTGDDVVMMQTDMAASSSSKSSGSNQPMQIDCGDEHESTVPMQTDVEEGSDVSMGTTTAVEQTAAPTGESCSKETAARCQVKPVSEEDLHVLAQCFYLPYEHGAAGRDMISNFTWLKERAVSMSREKHRKSEEYLNRALKWTERAQSFDDDCQKIVDSFKRIITCPNRALLYDIFPYISDMRGVISMLRSYVKWLGKAGVGAHTSATVAGEASDDKSSPTPISDLATSTAWLSSDPEPWVFRGGLSGEFQRLLPVSASFDLFCHVVPVEPQANTYVVRPYLAKDESAVLNICYTTSDNGSAPDCSFAHHKSLPGDRFVGALLTLCPEYTFVVEDEEGEICGYLAATLDARRFWTKYEMAYLPEMRAKYPLIADDDSRDVSPVVKDIIRDLHVDCNRFSYGTDKLMETYPSLLTFALTPHSHHNIIRNLVVCVLSALKSHNSFGVHVLVDADSQHYLELYNKLGFVKIPDDSVNLPTTAPSAGGGNLQLFGRAF